MSVEIIHWNPKRPVRPGKLGRLLPVRRHVNNFGDLIGPALVEGILKSRDVGTEARNPPRRLATVGSILHLTQAGDVVWGSGVNGKDMRIARPLDVRAVRGPISRRVLQESGISAPAIYGDPALLWSRFWPREHYAAGGGQSVVIVPNLHDYARYRSDPRTISPQDELHTVIGQIARADMVVSSSLHGIVLADSFGIPARLIPPAAEPMHKYFDYYLGTGRSGFQIAATVAEAIELGGELPPQWDGDAILEAFPFDLWRAR